MRAYAEHVPPDRWNHNIHYHRIVLDALPAGARTALDVGTGDGLLAADLRRRVAHVVGIDADADVLARARAEHPAIDYVHGDVMTYDFRPPRFDVVASIATVHHLPHLDAALRRLSALVASGGLLAVIGLACATRPGDWALGAVGAVQHRLLRRRRGYWEHTAPTVWPPPHSYAEARRTVREVLPDARWRRLPMWRYAVLWRRPDDAP